jgi:two-component system CheB/CheR fusion protein
VPIPGEIDTALLELMLVQSTNDAVILLDADGVIRSWMMGSRRIFGHSAEDVVGQRMDCLFTPEDRAAGIPRTELEQAKKSGCGEDDRWMLRRDGVRFWAAGFVQRLCDTEGRVVGFSKVLRDRTDVRGQVESLRNRAAALTADDERNVLVLGTLAHELKNPLAVLTNATALIDHAYPGDAKLAYAVNLLKRQTAYVSSVVDGLLEIVSVRVGKAALDLSEIDVAGLIADARDTIDPQTQAKSQTIEVLLPPYQLQLVGDRTRLTQVLVNLLSNASKFSPRDTTIWVKGSIEADEVVVRVEDAGRGIDAALLPTIFDLLSQAEAAGASRSNPGLGLGLAIVREYVQLHGGTVQVRSEGVGRGSEFTVRLPVVQREPSAGFA